MLSGLGVIGQRNGADQLKFAIDSIANKAIEIQASPGIQVMVIATPNRMIIEILDIHCFS